MFLGCLPVKKKKKKKKPDSSRGTSSAITALAGTPDAETIPVASGGGRNAPRDISSQRTGSSAVVATAESPYVEMTPIASSGGRLGSGLRDILKALKEISVVFPPLQATVAGVLIVLGKIDNISDIYSDFSAMARRMEALSQVLRRYHGAPSPDMRDRIDGVIQAINQQAQFIQAKQERGVVRRFLDEASDAHDIVDSLRAMSFLVDVFQVDTSLNTEVQAQKIQKDVTALLDAHELEKLQPVLDSRYDSITGGGGCMDGTRVGVLAQLLAWASDPHGPPVYWLNGMAGAGKSAIAQSFAKMLESGLHSQLGASFFCSRSSEVRSRVNRIVPTIAYQLAYRSGTYGTVLVDVLKKNRDRSFPTSGLREQFIHLVVPPSEALTSDQQPPLVVVIDALDECSDVQATRDFLKTLLRATHASSRIKFFLTSRPELHIQEELHHEISQSQQLRLHDIENDVVARDVSKYLSRQLSAISQRRRLPNWPSEQEISLLTQRTGQLFIFAFTVVQYLTHGGLPVAAIKLRLQNILAPPPNSAPNNRTGIIDNLYSQIIAAAYAGKEQNELHLMRRVLDTIICFREPLPATGISSLLEADAEDMLTLLEPFHSVIDVSHSVDAPVVLFHASFPDYVTDPRRSNDYALDANHHHLILAAQCIKHLNNSLIPNVCKIKRTTHISSIGDSNIAAVIPVGLQYACLHWAAHLSLASVELQKSAQIISLLQIFVNTHLLHWFEYLSLLKKLDVTVDCLQHAISSIITLRDATEITTIMSEAQRMVPQIFKVVCQYPLEVYYSAQWLPLSSKLRDVYLKPSSPRVLLGLDQHWSSCEQVLASSTVVHFVAFSPDGFHVASCSMGKPVAPILPKTITVQVWNIITGEQHVLIDVGYSVALAFSPDGSHIAYTSQTPAKAHVVKIWNIASEEEHSILLGHSESVNSIVFSPDGSHIVSGSKDQTVKIWNYVTGKEVRTLAGHSAAVTSVASSPVGSHIGSGSRDYTVRIWKFSTGEELYCLRGHTDFVMSVAFSSDGSRIASRSSMQYEIRIWEVTTGQQQQVLKNFGTSIIFSPNDPSRIVFGDSNSNNVCIWNIATGYQRTLTGHSDKVISVAFSSDGTRIASGSRDGSIRIWNVAVDEQQVARPLGHKNKVISVAISPDGSRAASGSQGHDIRIWNILTGAEQCTLSGSCWGESLAFSADSSLIASGSQDTTVRIWNSVTGEQKQSLRHSEMSRRVTSVAFSPDGSDLVSGCHDNSIHIWDVVKGVKRTRLSKHYGPVNSIAFSSDGTRIVSGSEETVWIWDAANGSQVFGPWVHAQKVGSVAFSPDGSHVVSSAAETVTIWNAVTGQQVRKLDVYGLDPIPLSPDGSRVAFISPGKFVILNPSGNKVYLLDSDRCPAPIYCAPSCRKSYLDVARLPI